MFYKPHIQWWDSGLQVGLNTNAGINDLANAAQRVLLQQVVQTKAEEWVVGNFDFWGSTYSAQSDLYTIIYFNQVIVSVFTY